MGVIREEVEREGLCPKCGGIGVYRYTVEAPIEGDAGFMVRIRYDFRCLVCGYGESKGVLIPLKAAYLLRYLLEPKSRGVIERAKLVADLKSQLTG